MKKIFESKLYAFSKDEGAERVYLYEIENEDEFWKIENISYEEKCELFGVQSDIEVPPGAVFRRYEFDNSVRHIIMYETLNWNV